MTEFTKKETAMKHVITLGLMTLKIGALAAKADKIDNDVDLCDVVTKSQSMIAYNLGIPMDRVTELFRIVLSEFDSLSPEMEAIMKKGINA
tara:strand:- start:229 stop:501 length:273 start_codon:yes stop_codon:yes gene_type:complete